MCVCVFFFSEKVRWERCGKVGGHSVLPRDQACG